MSHSIQFVTPPPEGPHPGTEGALLTSRALWMLGVSVMVGVVVVASLAATALAVRVSA